MAKQIWNYIINHKWSKDILRANFLYLLLMVIYALLHFHLKPVSWRLFGKTFLLMNLCLVINTLWTLYDHYRARQ